MGLFDAPADELGRLLARMERDGRTRRLTPLDDAALGRWACEAPQVVLRSEGGLELGSTSTSSLSLVLWDATTPEGDEVFLVGPDLPELEDSAPFGQVVMARVELDDDAHYERYRQLREAVYRLRVRGVMTRVLPSRQSVWCRVHRDSLRGGLDARVLGGSLCAAVRALPFVRAARVVLVTAGDDALAELAPLADRVLEVATALSKIHETAMDLDCDDCELRAVCDSVQELRRIHTRLAGEREAGE